MNPFRVLIDALVRGDISLVREKIRTSPILVREKAAAGATREEATNYFYDEIKHYMYAGDTALHMAAAAFQFEIAQLLIDSGANIEAENRRGARPLHYACDSNVWNPVAQVATIECLLRAGANANALDKSGVGPIHRAVRTRCAPAVEALLRGGARRDLRNKSGSTPLDLTVHNTGRSGSGTPEAKEQQRHIIELLIATVQ